MEEDKFSLAREDAASVREHAHILELTVRKDW